MHELIVSPQQGLERGSVAVRCAIDKVLIPIGSDMIDNDMGVCRNRGRVGALDRVQR